MAAGNPLLNPGQSLSGPALLQAAKALVNASVNGPYSELAHQIAVNQQQGAAAQAKTAGYYGQLGQQAQQGFQDEQQVGSNLNAQLQKIGQDTQGSLGQIGADAQAQQAKYSPGMSGSQQPGMQALAAEMARQQGLASQNSGAFRNFGATQGANYSGLAASNLGTYALRGQESLGQIGQASQLANEPLIAKQAGLTASRGALLAKTEGALRQQEITNQITQQGLGLKSQALKVQAAADQARINATIRGQNVSLSLGQARNRIAGINAKLAGQRLSETQRHNLATEKTAYQRAINAAKTGGASGGTKPLTPNEQNHIYNQVDTIQSLIREGRAAGQTGAQIRQMLQNGGPKGSLTKYDSHLVDAAYELLGWGHITPRTARWLHQSGVRGGRYKVAPPPTQRGIGNTVGGVIGGAGSAIGGALGG